MRKKAFNHLRNGFNARKYTKITTISTCIYAFNETHQYFQLEIKHMYLQFPPMRLKWSIKPLKWVVSFRFVCQILIWFCIIYSNEELKSHLNINIQNDTETNWIARCSHCLFNHCLICESAIRSDSFWIWCHFVDKTRMFRLNCDNEWSVMRDNCCVCW